MKKLIKVAVKKLKRLFSRKSLSSVEQVHWINHVYDVTKPWPDGHLHWANIHGFDEGPGAVYWIGVDYRYLGIRIEDYVLKFKSKALYDEYVNLCPEDFLKKIKGDSRLDYRRGESVNVEFVFKWGGEEKTFDVHLDSDIFAEEK